MFGRFEISSSGPVESPMLVQSQPRRYFWELAWLFDRYGSPKLPEDLIRFAYGRYAKTGPTDFNVSPTGRAKHPEQLKKAMSRLKADLLKALVFAEQYASQSNNLGACAEHIKLLLAVVDTSRSDSETRVDPYSSSDFRPLIPPPTAFTLPELDLNKKEGDEEKMQDVD